MSLGSFEKDHPRIYLGIGIIASGILFVPILMFFGLGFNSSAIVGTVIMALLAITIMMQKPSKEVEQFVQNISPEILSVEKSSLGFRIKTRDFEMIRINYMPPLNLQGTINDAPRMGLNYKERYILRESKNMAGKAESRLDSSIGTDVLIFLFELPKDQVNAKVRSSGEFAMSAIADTNAAWHEIKQVMGDEGALIHSGAISAEDNVVFVKLSFDRTIALEKSMQVYETLKAVKNKMLAG